jgi:hypothetical protein
VDFSYNDELFAFVHTFGPAYAQILYSKDQIDPDYFKIELPASLMVYSIAYSPFEPFLVTGGYNDVYNPIVQIWDLNRCVDNEACEPNLVSEAKLSDINDLVETICFTQPDELILHIGEELWIWNYVTNEEKRPALLDDVRPVERLICNEHKMGVVYENGDFLLVDPIGYIPLVSFNIDKALFDERFDIDISPDGTEIAIASFGNPLQIWEIP